MTEFDINIADEDAQAQYTRDFMTAVFSHPSVTGFLMWGFWEGRHWLPSGAMFRRNWSIKPNGEAYKELVFREWWTDVEGVTGEDGIYRTRGFLGEYDVEATLGGRIQTASLTAVRDPAPNYAVIGRLAPGTITAEGVVNAASYVGGAVTPGEIVTIFGAGFGSPALALASYDAAGYLPRFVGDTRVLFDGAQAPMIYMNARLGGTIKSIVAVFGRFLFIEMPEALVAARGRRPGAEPSR